MATACRASGHHALHGPQLSRDSKTMNTSYAASGGWQPLGSPCLIHKPCQQRVYPWCMPTPGQLTTMRAFMPAVMWSRMLQ